jgi:ABC-type polysaccharide/polyol phosphate export permease
MSKEEARRMVRTAWRNAADYLWRIWEYRYFWMCLVKSDLQRRYRRSVFGIGWSLLQPIAMSLVLCLVYQRVFHLKFWEYGPLLLTGLAFWNMLSGTVLQGCGCFLNAEGYMRQEPAPLAIYSLRTVLTVGFHFLIALTLALVFSWSFNGPGHLLAFLSLAPTLGLLFGLGWALATLMAFANVYFPDTQHLAEIGLQALFFMTPVIYPPRMLTDSGMSFLVAYNPLAILLHLLHAPILTGQAPTLGSYAAAAAVVAVPAASAVYVLARREREVIFAM